MDTVDAAALGLVLVLAVAVVWLILRDIRRRHCNDLALWNQARELEQQMQRRTAEHERSRRFMRAVVENMQEAVFVNRSGRIAFANDRCAKLLGAGSAEAVIGRSPLEFLAPESHPLVESRYQEMIASGKPAPAREETIHRADGTTADVEVAAAPFRLDEDDAVVVILHDITARKATERQLRHVQKMEAIGNLTGGMAHDFNNLLGVIVGNLDLLADHVEQNPLARELVEEALDGAMRGADLTRRLLAFARRQPLAPQRVDINELATNIFQLLARTLGEQIEITLALAPDLWPVLADPVQLESCLTNLAMNARDAMPDGGRLTVATRNRLLDADYAGQHADLAPGEYVAIEISDTGTGMPAEVLARVFEPFFTTKEVGKGTGLGLAMVFGFMKQSGGHINVYSEVGEGTTFRLYLPRSDAQTTSLELPEMATPRGGVEVILVVEDNPKVRAVVVRQLQGMGYRVREAGNAPAALELLRNEAVDLMFSDIVMPGGMSGIELAQQARKAFPALKVVLTSGFPGVNLNGGRGLPDSLRLLSKPYRKEELARIVRETLDG